jgi:ADP-heptose:LPS heptosyltransferase
MRVDTMRRIDFWAGVPLCFLATLLLRVWRLFRPAVSALPKKVLFVELSEMGSAILADPAMRKIKREADAELFFVIFAQNRASLALLGTVPAENIFTLRAGGMLGLVVDTLRFLVWVRRRQIDTVIDLELFSRFTALLTGASGAANRVGFYSFYNEGLYRGELLTHRVLYNPHIHIAKNFVALINALLSPASEVPYSKTLVPDSEIVLEKADIPESAREEARTVVSRHAADFQPSRQKLVLINPNASELLVQRRWPPENYAALIRLVLGADPLALVLITGAPAEREEAGRLTAAVGDERCVNFAGATSFAQLPALYSISHLMVTNDSGPAHFAAVTDLPTFVIFGPETPALYGALGRTTPIYAGLACSPCVSAANHRKTSCRNNVCLQVITPGQVFNTISSQLKPAQ